MKNIAPQTCKRCKTTQNSAVYGPIKGISALKTS